MAQAEIAHASAPIKTRKFWTWDHSTEWALNRPGAQTMGACNPYNRSSETFVEDYMKLLRWCGRHSIDAVVVWGLLRDCHGGLEAAKRLCEVAGEQGVRLLCGVGLNAYGGVYYEGDSPYSLRRFLDAHPELSAVDLVGNRLSSNTQSCPSRPENREFIAESMEWLFKSLPLGGVQMETGDSGVCRCGLCKERRQNPVSSFSWEDMALMYPIAAEAIRSVSPEAWIVCETYSHPEPDAQPEKAPEFGGGKPAWANRCLEQFPDGASVQWVCDQYVKPRLATPWTKAGVASKARHRHIMRAHFGTYWHRFRGELAVDWIADMAQHSMASGFEGLSLFGEVSPYHTGAELNYLALENCGSAANPGADLEVFLRDVAAPLLGGEELAHDYLRCARTVDDLDRIGHALASIYARLASLPPSVARRWAWLANWLASFVYS